MRDAHHGCDLPECNFPRVQICVDVLGNLVVRPTPPEIVADEPTHPGEGGVVVRRPVEADGAQLSEVSIIGGIGSGNRGVTNQGSASHDGDGQSGQPARGKHLMGFLSSRLHEAVSLRVESGREMNNS